MCILSTDFFKKMPNSPTDFLEHRGRSCDSLRKTQHLSSIKNCAKVRPKASHIDSKVSKRGVACLEKCLLCRL